MSGESLSLCRLLVHLHVHAYSWCTSFMAFLGKCRSNVWKSAVLLFRDGVRNQACPPCPNPHLRCPVPTWRIFVQSWNLVPLTQFFGIHSFLFLSKQCSSYRVVVVRTWIQIGVSGLFRKGKLLLGETERLRKGWLKWERELSNSEASPLNYGLVFTE